MFRLFQWFARYIPSPSMILAVLAGLSVGIGIGFYTKSQFVKAAQTKAIEAAIAEYEHTRKIDHKVQDERQEKVRVIEKVVTVKKEIPVYVPQNGDSCNLTRGAVELLNRARSAGRDVPDAPALTDEEKQAPSTITQRAEIEAHFDCATEYNKLAADHDALIEWLEQTRGQKVIGHNFSFNPQ